MVNWSHMNFIMKCLMTLKGRSKLICGNEFHNLTTLLKKCLHIDVRVWLNRSLDLVPNLVFDEAKCT